MAFERVSGILLHPTSLPGPYGIGEIGDEAMAFIDALAESGQKLWQILPINATGNNASPYSATTTFAANPLLIDIDALIEAKLLTAAEVAHLKALPQAKVDYGVTVPARLDVLALAGSRLAAEADGGLNIEGLAATSDGGLLIGFRNPLRARRALVVPLRNPSEVIEGRRARLGAAIELDLGGRGIRSIELVGSAYLIVAGPTADQGSFALYRWSGQASEAPTLLADLTSSGTRPEALMAIPQSARVQLLSDDGGMLVDGIECKKLPKNRQSFRSFTLTP